MVIILRDFNNWIEKIAEYLAAYEYGYILQGSTKTLVKAKVINIYMQSKYFKELMNISALTDKLIDIKESASKNTLKNYEVTSNFMIQIIKPKSLSRTQVIDNINHQCLYGGKIISLDISGTQGRRIIDYYESEYSDVSWVVNDILTLVDTLLGGKFINPLSVICDFDGQIILNGGEIEINQILHTDFKLMKNFIPMTRYGILEPKNEHLVKAAGKVQHFIPGWTNRKLSIKWCPYRRANYMISLFHNKISDMYPYKALNIEVKTLSFTEITNLKIKPTVCFMCNAPLYGWIYCVNVRDNTFWSVCPSCVHSNNFILSQFKCIYKYQLSITLQDVVKKMKCDDSFKEIILNADNAKYIVFEFNSYFRFSFIILNNYLGIECDNKTIYNLLESTELIHYASGKQIITIT